MATLATEFGEIPTEEVLRVYNMMKRRDQRASERRTALLHSSVQLQEKNKERAKAYYEKNKDAILEKRRIWYLHQKEIQDSIG